jgi:hypothetical protein
LIPFFASSLIEIFGNYLAAANVVQSVAIFSFASLFLFFAVLPLAYAPETLNLKEREFKNYIQKAMQTKVKLEKEEAFRRGLWRLAAAAKYSEWYPDRVLNQNS